MKFIGDKKLVGIGLVVGKNKYVRRSLCSLTFGTSAKPSCQVYVHICLRSQPRT